MFSSYHSNRTLCCIVRKFVSSRRGVETRKSREEKGAEKKARREGGEVPLRRRCKGQPPPVPLAPFTWKNLKGRFFTLGGREININERKTTVVLCTVVCRNERERGEMCPSQGRGKARAAIIASRLQRFPPSGYGYGV